MAMEATVPTAGTKTRARARWYLTAKHREIAEELPAAAAAGRGTTTRETSEIGTFATVEITGPVQRADGTRRLEGQREAGGRGPVVGVAASERRACGSKARLSRHGDPQTLETPQLADNRVRKTVRRDVGTGRTVRTTTAPTKNQILVAIVTAEKRAASATCQRAERRAKQEG